MPDAALILPGFFGKLPAMGDFVTRGLPRVVTDRWDRWMARELGARPVEGPLDPRAWRFTCPDGIFGPQLLAGVWRMSEDRVGRRYPFAVMRLGPPPDPADPWFDAAAALVARAVEDGERPVHLAEDLARLPVRKEVKAPRIAFWCDEWDVHELVFADIHDLADHGLPAMRAPRVETEEAG